MNIIVAADQNWGIGRENNLLARIPKDMGFFMRMTMGKTVVMGRLTWESIPNPPLPERRNIILSRSEDFAPEGALVCRSPEEVFGAIEGTPTEDVFIIGGESIYRLMLPHCDVAYVTRFQSPEGTCPDRFFGNLDEVGGWRMEKISDWAESRGIPFCHFRYTKV